MTLEFFSSQWRDAYQAGQLICNALNSTKLYEFFTAPYYDLFFEEYPDGNVHVAMYMYRSCRIGGNEETYYGNKAGLEQFISKFYMPKLITF